MMSSVGAAPSDVNGRCRAVVTRPTASLTRVSSRVSATKAAIRRAVVEILEVDGAAGVTFQQVAEVSGVGRATVYRHYETVTDLLEDALLHTGIPELPISHDQPIRERILEALRLLTAELTAPAAAAVVLTVLDQARQPSRSRELRDAYVASIVEQLTSALDEAVAAGELLPGAEPTEVFDLLMGPVVARCFLDGGIPDDGFLGTVVDHALLPWLAVE